MKPIPAALARHPNPSLLPPMRSWWKFLALFAAAVLVIIAAAGCSVTTVVTHQGDVFTRTQFGNDTRAGAIDITTSTGARVRIENLDQQARALIVAEKALDAMRAVQP